MTVKFDLILDTVRRFLHRGAITNLENMIAKMHPADVAKVIRHLPTPGEKRTIFELVKENRARAEILSEIDGESVSHVLEDRAEKEIVAILRELPSDDLADILAALPEGRRAELLKAVKDAGSDVEQLMRYPEETAGGIMTTEFLALRQEMRVHEAIAHLQAASLKKMVFYLYVTDEEGRLVGVLSLRQLLMVPPSTVLRDLMTTGVISVSTDTDQEEVARQVARYNLLAIPVVDREQRLVGIITFDDVIDVIREEATEDMLKAAGVEEEVILNASSLSAVRFRLPWLLANLVGGLVSGAVLWWFRPTIQQVIALVSFIPVIAAMGGNIGLQSSTIVVRGIATGRIELADLRKVLAKEWRVGAMLGLVSGLLVAFVAGASHAGPMLGVVVGGAMFLTINLAALMGTLTPILLKKMNVDPAISSGPFVTSVNDISGSLIYLSLATGLLHFLT